MARKDTILIAVLINIGLLVLLFTTSLKKSDEPVIAKVHTAQPLPEAVAASPKPLPVKNEPKEPPSPEKPFTPLLQETPKPALVKKEEKIDTRSLIPVIVKQGDVLEKIAKSHHTSVEEVMKINRLPNSFLKIGQVLYIPSQSGGIKESPLKPVGAPPLEEKFYVVKNGDNPWTIAVKNHIKVDELLKLNSLDEEKAKKLKPGDRLRIQ